MTLDLVQGLGRFFFPRSMINSPVKLKQMKFRLKVHSPIINEGSRLLVSTRQSFQEKSFGFSDFKNIFKKVLSQLQNIFFAQNQDEKDKKEKFLHRPTEELLEDVAKSGIIDEAKAEKYEKAAEKYRQWRGESSDKKE